MAKLYLTIPWRGNESRAYRVEPIITDPGAALVAWKLTKSDGQNYVVSLTEHGLACTCWDFLSRRENVGEDCKHLAALRALCLFGRRNLPRSEE